MKNQNPLVSIIVPTRNSAFFLPACLESIRNQSYQEIELIVVDNSSADNTKEIAKKYANLVLDKGPERSAQRNFGVEKAKGEWVLLIDSDMELTPKVVQACVDKISQDAEVKGIIIPEESFGVGLWARCKRLEKSFYIGVDWIEAARFFDKKVYEELDGYDTSMYAGEDWDFSQRVGQKHKIARIKEFIRHNEGKIYLLKTLTKKYHYAKNADNFLSTNKVSSKMSHPAGPLERYKLFFSKPDKLFKNPTLGLALLFMKTGEFGFGGIGYLKARKR
jgi:glycosyltransferase involved in cell wall biosynthesis